MLPVIAGQDQRDRHSIPCDDVDWIGAARRGKLNLRVAYYADWGGRPLDPEVRQICDAAAVAFERHLGCVVEVTEPQFGW